VRAHPLDHAGRERLVHERAQAGVIRGISHEHRARKIAFRGLWPIDSFDQWGKAIAAITRIAQARDDIVIAREDPEAQGTLVDGIFLAQRLVERVRIRVEFGQARIENRLNHRHRRSSSDPAMRPCHEGRGRTPS